MCKIQTITTWLLLFLAAPLTYAYADSKELVLSTHIEEGNFIYDRTYMILHEAFKRMGYELRLDSYPGKRALERSNNGFTDGEAHRIEGIETKYTNLIRVPEIQQTVSDSAYSIKNISLPNGWQDLSGLRVGIIRGTVSNTEMCEKYASQVFELDSYRALVLFLMKGRADVIVGTSDVLAPPPV